jgi:hypothetical protein
MASDVSEYCWRARWVRTIELIEGGWKCYFGR